MGRVLAGGAGRLREGGGVAVVLLHGVGLGRGFWGDAVRELSRRRVVVVPELYAPPKHSPKRNPSPAGNDPKRKAAFAGGTAGRKATLAGYAAEAARELRARGVRRAVLVGHSLGAHVAMEMARANPDIAAGVVALGAVFRRSAAAKKAVLARAQLLKTEGKGALLDSTLERWREVGDSGSNGGGGSNNSGSKSGGGSDRSGNNNSDAALRKARRLLRGVDERAYCDAYEVFAECDSCEATVQNISAPMLFAAGENDPNATPLMAKRLAKIANNGAHYIFAGRRHLFPLTAGGELCELIGGFCDSVSKAQDENKEGALRRAFGSFITGVTVVAAFDSANRPRGFTANSFASVSLRPPLVSVCIAKGARGYEVFRAAKHFSVNILGEKQRALAAKFASQRSDKFDGVKWQSKAGAPALGGAVAWFGCAAKKRIACGDHCILIGEVRDYAESGGAPLGYLRGAYIRPELERRAQAAAGSGVVGAIVEKQDAVYLCENKNGKLSLPFAKSGGDLREHIRKLGMECDFSFLYSVYARARGGSAVVYRANWRGGVPTCGAFYPLNNLPAARIKESAVRVLLRRFAGERQSGEHQLYIGDEREGAVHNLRPESK